MECGIYDKVKELRDYAISRRDDCISNGTVHDVVYWNGYIDAINKFEKELTQ